MLGTATVEGGFACVFYGPSAPSPTTPDTAQSDSVRVVVVKGTDALQWYNDYKSKVSPPADHRLWQPGLLRRLRLVKRAEG